jgi:NADPH2:quinone reductase
VKAFVLTGSGPAIADVAQPSPRPHEIVVRVRAAALNRADLGMAAGYRHGAAGGVGQVLGMEWAGEVVETGPEVTDLAVGHRVMGSGAGAFAEYAAADAGRASPIPEGLDFADAACLPVGLQTMHDAVVTHGELKPGQTVLIQGASSGVGLIAMQIAKAMGAGLVVGSSTNAERRARLAEFGADLAVDSADPAWVDQVLAATDGKGVDLTVDQVSGATANQNLAATRILGRIVNVGRLGGMRGEFDFDLHALRRITYVGVTFRTRSAEEVRQIVRRMREDLWDAVSAGKISVPIDRTFPLEAAADAFDHMRANRHFGKIVLSL